MDSGSELEKAWTDAEAALPPGWRLDGLRCASTGLAVEHRSEDWRAVARGPDDTMLEGRGGEPLTALSDLAEPVSSRAESV